MDDRRDRDETPTGFREPPACTSDPRHPQDDPEGADRWEAPERDKLDR